LYGKKEPFSMSVELIGWFLSALGLSRSFSVFVILPVLLAGLSRLYRLQSTSNAEQNFLMIQAARVGMFCSAVFSAGIGLAWNKGMLFAMASLSGLDAIWNTTLRVVLVEVGAKSGAGEGEVLGVVGFLQVFIGSVAPIAFQAIYAGTVGIIPGFVFFLVAGLTSVGLVLSFALDTQDLAANSTDKRANTRPLLD
jgi:hypothetical protein